MSYQVEFEPEALADLDRMEIAPIVNVFFVRSAIIRLGHRSEIYDM